MAFTGTPVVTQVTDSIVRITGVSLAAGASGVIALSGQSGSPTPDIVLPPAFKTEGMTFLGQPVGLQDMLDITVQLASDVNEAKPIAITKTGTTAANFRGTIKNNAGSVSGSLEIYIKNHE